MAIVEEKADTTNTTEVVEARFREGRNLIREGKVIVEDEAKIACSMRRLNNSLRREIKNRTVKFKELLRKAKKKEFSFGRVESEEISSHPVKYFICSARWRRSVEQVKSE